MVKLKKVKFTVYIICHNMLHKVNTVILIVLVNTITSIQPVKNVKHEYTIPWIYNQCKIWTIMNFKSLETIQKCLQSVSKQTSNIPTMDERFKAKTCSSINKQKSVVSMTWVDCWKNKNLKGRITGATKAPEGAEQGGGGRGGAMEAVSSLKRCLPKVEKNDKNPKVTWRPLPGPKVSTCLKKSTLPSHCTNALTPLQTPKSTYAVHFTTV